MNIHETAIIHPSAKIEQSVQIKAFTEIRSNVIIGAGSLIDSHCCFTGDSIIGQYVTIRNSCIIARGVWIGNHTFISPQCMFQNIDSDGKEVGGAKIGKRCFIGTNVTFKEGITVCDNVIIGTKSYVNKSIMEPGTYVGVPAKRVK